MALDYRERQLHVLQTALPQLSSVLQRTLSFNSFCQHDPQLTLPNDYFEFLSLECAYSWLNVHYPNIYNEVAQLISKDQDEPLPLNWAVLVEDWDHTYWIVWIYIVWMIWARDGESFSESHLNLSTWLEEMNE
jgi:histone-lysine N-methyltransferase SETD3